MILRKLIGQSDREFRAASLRFLKAIGAITLPDQVIRGRAVASQNGELSSLFASVEGRMRRIEDIKVDEQHQIQMLHRDLLALKTVIHSRLTKAKPAGASGS